MARSSVIILRVHTFSACTRKFYFTVLYVSENLPITDLCTSIMQLMLMLPKPYISSLLNLFIESLLKFNLKYFTLKSING